MQVRAVEERGPGLNVERVIEVAYARLAPVGPDPEKRGVHLGAGDRAHALGHRRDRWRPRDGALIERQPFLRLEDVVGLLLLEVGDRGGVGVEVGDAAAAAPAAAATAAP